MELHLQGLPIEDAFVYRTSLYAWTFEGNLIVISVGAVEEAIRRKLGDEKRIADGICFLLFHSNRIGAQRFQYQSVRTLTDLGTDLTIEIDLSLVPHHTFRTVLEADSLMDVMIYFDRMHLSTDTGLYELDLPRSLGEWQKEIALECTLPIPCYCSSASLGALATSCGDEGLIVAFNNYEPLRHVEPRRALVAEQSQRSTYGSGGLFNFVGRTEYEYLTGNILDDTPLDQAERRSILIDLEPAHVVDSTLDQELSRADIDYIMFSRRQLVFLSDGQIRAVSLDKDPLGRKSSRHPNVLGSYGRNPISISATRSMLIVETDDALVVCVPDVESEETPYVVRHWNCGPTIALRTFPMSRRYLDLALRTSESGTHLYGLIPSNNTES